VNVKTCFICLAAAFFVISCSGVSKPFKPVSYENPEDRQLNLIIFLQGRGGNLKCLFGGHTCFEKEGFISEIRDRNLPFDMIAPNAHFGYYRNQDLVRRIKEDIIQPAQAKGYEKIWLVGVSMGGLGSLFYFEKYPNDIEGVILLGPYLSKGKVINDIKNQGGLASWKPGEYDPVKEWDRFIWEFLKQQTMDKPSAHSLYLGLGTNDYYYTTQKLLAESMPQDHVVETDGRHSFTSFKKIWDQFLDQQILTY